MHRGSIAAVTCATVAFVLLGMAPAAAARDNPPTAPTNLRAAQLAQTSVTLAWGASTDDRGVLEYAAWAPATPGVPAVPSVRVPGTQLTATLTALRPNTTYNFQVQAWDGRNWSWQAVLTLTTPRELVAPSGPSGLRLNDIFWGQQVDSVTASTVLLRWQSSTDDFGPITYEVLVDGVPTPNAWPARVPGSPPGSFDGAWVRQLSPGTTHQFAVRARDGSGNLSAVSDTLSVTTDQNADVVAPTTPILLTANIGAAGYCPDEIWATWSGSTDNADPASAIEYEVRVNGTIIEVIPGGTRTISYTEVHGLNVLTIVAVDRAGNASSPSNSMSGRTNWGAECFS